MPIESQWWMFLESVIDIDRDDPGVYELGDDTGAVVYIGSSNQLRARLREHLNEPERTCVRKNATKYRIEYAKNYKERERELYDAHLMANGGPPACNDTGL